MLKDFLLHRAIPAIVLVIAYFTIDYFFIHLRPKFESIPAQEFATLIDSTDVVLVDVRTPSEHNAGHIPGTDFNIDVKDESFLLQSQISLKKETPVAIYCRSGNRSKTAADILSKDGYTVYELATGFNGWIEAGYKGADSLLVIDTSREGLTLYYPQYNSIDLVCGAASPEEDSKAIFSCPAAFTGETILEFKHTNIAGHHVSNGEFHRGYACKPNTGAFVWYNGTWKFLLKDYASELKIAAESAGMGVAQNMIIHNFEEQPLFRKNSFQYRALCELDGKLCIIQSNQSVKYSDFVDMLKETGVKHALYLDMGGWNHSWYRKWDNSKPTYIKNNPHKYYTNWLTFYK